MATTSVSSQHPSITLLRNAVEARYGKHLSPAIVESFAEKTLNGQLNADTIRQLWGWRKSSYKTIRRSTLDILAQYVEEADWDAFVQKQVQLQGQDSELKGSYDGVSSKELEVGQIVHVSWQPDRTAYFVYRGNEHFYVLSATNSNLLKEGDEFDCCMLVVGEPAFLANLIHEDTNFGRYTIGKVNGISSISLE